MPVTLSSPVSFGTASSTPPQTPKNLPKTNFSATPGANRVQFGVGSQDGQDSIELAQRRMEEGTFSEISLDAPSSPERATQNRRHGLDLERTFPQPTAGPVEAETPEPETHPEAQALRGTPSRFSKAVDKAVNRVVPFVVAGLGGGIVYDGSNQLILPDEDPSKGSALTQRMAGLFCTIVGMSFIGGAALVHKHLNRAPQAERQTQEQP